MNITVLDFETYFDAAYSLRNLSIPEYVHDPRFRVHGLAIRWPDGRTDFVNAGEGIRDLQPAFGNELERTTVVCHHAHFDLYVLAHRFGIHPRYFTDTLSLACHVLGRRHGGNGQSAALADLATHFGLEAKKDLDFMCGVIHPDPRQAAELAEYAKRDVKITAQLAELLLPEMTRPDVEIPVIMHTVRLFTCRSVAVDVDQIEPLECRIAQETEAARESARATAEQLSSNKQFADLLSAALARTNRQLPLKPGKNGLIPAIAKKDPPMQALLEDDDPRVAALVAARLGKKGQDAKLARLQKLQATAAATGGRLPPYLVYCGGHTGRFAGGGGWNIQNLGRSGVGGEIRGLLRADPGCQFVIGDLAQIEARVTAWYAGQGDMLGAFSERRDIYSEFASQVFGRPVRKPREDDPHDVAAELRPLRQVGKQAVLKLGFGMGALNPNYSPTRCNSGETIA